MKLLYITHRATKYVNRFWFSSITAAHELGYEFHLACNMQTVEHGTWENDCSKYGIVAHQIDFDRNPLGKSNLQAKRQLLALMEKERFDIVHCNTPTGGLIGRICAYKAEVPYVIYQAHGFHFWKGAPLKNWLCYYPVERHLAKHTDSLITINQEDYMLAKRKMPAKRVEYISGVGIDINKFAGTITDKEATRKLINVPENAFFLISVGELIKRKNHEVVIRAISQLQDINVHYVIVGTGVLNDYLLKLIQEQGVSKQVHLLGYRRDVAQLYKAADACCFPSYQEGLPVALMEAMATGLPCIASRIRGNVDLLPNSDYLFKPTDSRALVSLIEQMKRGIHLEEELKQNEKRLRLFAFDAICNDMKKIYARNFDDQI